MDMLGCIVIFILIAIFFGLAFVFEWWDKIKKYIKSEISLIIFYIKS